MGLNCLESGPTGLGSCSSLGGILSAAINDKLGYNNKNNLGIKIIFLY